MIYKTNICQIKNIIIINIKQHTGLLHNHYSHLGIIANIHSKLFTFTLLLLYSDNHTIAVLII